MRKSFDGSAFMKAFDFIDSMLACSEVFDRGWAIDQGRGTANGRSQRPLAARNLLMTTKTNSATTILEVVERLYAMDPEWVVFFREVLGVDGIVRRTFRDSQSLVRFECSPEYARIREMLDDLRSRQKERPSERETLRVVTVRMPRTLHETLRAEAEQLRVSINSLCISKLIKLLDDEEQKELVDGRQREPVEVGGDRTGADL